MNHNSAGATPMKMQLEEYRGKMGRLTDAGALLRAIEGSGRDMRLPNLYLAPDTEHRLELKEYIDDEASSITLSNEEVATANLHDNLLTVRAKSVGQTTLTIVCSNKREYRLTVTVRSGASENGWF